MRQKSVHPESPSERIVKNIRRATRKRHSSEEKIRIVLDGLRGEASIAELCRREGIAESLYYSWSKEFLEAGKKRLAGDTDHIAAQTVLLELEGGPASMRDRDLNEMYRTQEKFDASGPVARKVKRVYDFLQRAFPEKTPGLERY